MDQPLHIRMRELAITGHEKGDELLDLADQLEEAAEVQDTKRLLSVWVKCRKLWRDCTGEPIITMEPASQAWLELMRRRKKED